MLTTQAAHPVAAQWARTSPSAIEAWPSNGVPAVKGAMTPAWPVLECSLLIWVGWAERLGDYSVSNSGREVHQQAGEVWYGFQPRPLAKSISIRKSM